MPRAAGPTSPGSAVSLESALIVQTLRVVEQWCMSTMMSFFRTCFSLPSAGFAVEAPAYAGLRSFNVHCDSRRVRDPRNAIPWFRGSQFRRSGLRLLLRAEEYRRIRSALLYLQVGEVLGGDPKHSGDAAHQVQPNIGVRARILIGCHCADVAHRVGKVFSPCASRVRSLVLLVWSCSRVLAHGFAASRRQVSEDAPAVTPPADHAARAVPNEACNGSCARQRELRRAALHEGFLFFDAASAGCRTAPGTWSPLNSGLSPSSSPKRRHG